jgi:hypothetical protein
MRTSLSIDLILFDIHRVKIERLHRDVHSQGVEGKTVSNPETATQAPENDES